MPIERVVVLNCDALEVMRILHASSLVVGVCREVEKDRAFWGRLASLPIVGSWKRVNVEAIFRLHPDLVIAYGNNPGPELDRQMALLDLQLLRLNFYKIRTLLEEIKVLGKVLGREKRAAEYVRWFREKLVLIRNRIERLKGKRPRVYCECYSDFIAVGPGSGSDEMCWMGGGDNIGRELSIPFARVSAEWVIGHNPQIIVKPTGGGRGYERKDNSFFLHLRDEIARRRGFQEIDAVKKGRIYVIDSSIWTGPASIIGLGYLARWFHPALFKDIDPERWHKEYLERFQGIPYRGFYVSK